MVAGNHAGEIRQENPRARVGEADALTGQPPTNKKSDKARKTDKIQALNFERVLAMKKRLFTLVAVASLALLTMAGCSNSIDTAKIRAAFQDIGPSQKAQLEQALSAIDAGKYKEALLPLRKVAAGAKLDKNQSKMIDSAIARVRAKIAEGQ
jgi:outer membrane murein-binding lipoprotein Lpp